MRKSIGLAKANFLNPSILRLDRIYFKIFPFKRLTIGKIAVILTNAGARLQLQDQVTSMLHGKEIDIPEQACCRWIDRDKFLFKD